MKSRRLRGAAAAAASAVALAGCGVVHPGAAARVGDVSVSDDALERNTRGFCELIDVINLAQQGSNPPIPLRQALLSALNTLVIGTALDQVAENNGVEVTPAEIRAWRASLPLDFSNVPAANADELRAATERVARNTLLLEKLGRVAYERRNPGSSAAQAPPQDLQELGQRLVNSYMRRVGVETDPRYGQVLDTQQLPGTGSLSIPVSSEGVDGQTVPEASNQLPPGQECA